MVIAINTGTTDVIVWRALPFRARSRHQPQLARRLARTVAGIAALLVTAGAAHADAAKCAALNGRLIARQAIALPSYYGGSVSLATYMPAKDGVGPFCKVVGQVNPVDPKSHPVLFEVNLPDDWNNKAVQYGGNGVNGVLVTGLNPLPDQPPDIPTPLGRGYITVGTDGGHVAADGFSFMQLKEEFSNHAFGAYKKAHDVAVDLASAYYGKKPARFYFDGHSEGGREAMTMVERYPADYDGVVAGAPIIGWTGLMLAGYNQWLIVHGGGWLSPAKLALVQKASLDACDALDGLKDGVIGRYLACDGKVKLDALRCPDGSDAGDACLSDAQLAFVAAIRSPFPFKAGLANGAMAYPGWLYGGEAQPQGFVPWRISAQKPAADDLGRMINSNGLVRFGIVGKPDYAGPVPWDQAARIQEISALMDMTDPDLSAFRGRGGKLIMKENGADYAQSPQEGFAYYKSVAAKMGQPVVDGFVRLYVNPGVSHIGNGLQADGSAVPDKEDLLGALDAWVESGSAPETLTETSYTRTAPFTPIATRPLCRYPLYPRYSGRGDPKQAASFTCTPN